MNAPKLANLFEQECAFEFLVGLNFELDLARSNVLEKIHSFFTLSFSPYMY